MEVQESTIHMIDLRRIAGMTVSLAAALMISGCDSAAGKASTAKQVSRWKTYSTNKSSTAMGLVLEKEGKDVTAKLYALKDNSGFVFDEELATGKYVPERKSLVLIPAGIPMLSSVEEWIAVNGPHFVVPIGKSPTNLILEIKSPGLPGLPTDFRRFHE
jgi:hypothetical protein